MKRKEIEQLKLSVLAHVLEEIANTDESVSLALVLHKIVESLTDYDLYDIANTYIVTGLQYGVIELDKDNLTIKIKS